MRRISQLLLVLWDVQVLQARTDHPRTGGPLMDALAIGLGVASLVAVAWSGLVSTMIPACMLPV
ncbi:hypothetical protein [Terrihabitans sp. B22-R8]|uniref:hypothetical protein n=1 Tax=Terrihabitans sp. B22-R8 TaxID=3425128 RepID=UPI00403C7D73